MAEVKASPSGGSCPRSGLMRGKFAIATIYRTVAAHPPLIRPCGATFPPQGKALEHKRSNNIKRSTP